MYTVLYKIEVFDQVAGSGTFIECGILYAESFSQAMQQLETYYGDDIQTVHFIEMYDMSVFTFAPERMDAVKDLIEEVC